MNFAQWMASTLACFFVCIWFAVWVSNGLDDQRIERGHFEHRGQIYIITPAKPVAR